jgi:hypothetical protein
MLSETLVYRGVSKFDGIFKVVNPFLSEPRLPRNSDLNVHKVSDDWFYKKFGVKARSQCIFCSTDIAQAKEYCGVQGVLLKVTVPEGLSYSIVYSEDVHDFIEIEIGIKDVNDDEQIINWLESKHYKIVSSVEELPKNFHGEIMLYSKVYQCEEYTFG